MATFVDIRRRDPEITAGTAALLERIGALRAAGCGSLELAWVADGRLHGWVQADVEPWDWHPGALLVAEAGGATAVAGRWHVAAASPALRDALLRGRSLHRVSETRRNPASELTTDRPPSIADAVGGPLGVAESVVPAAAYVLTYTVSGQDTTISLIVAVALGVLFGVARADPPPDGRSSRWRASPASRSPRTSSRAPAAPRTSSSRACWPTPATRSRT